MSIHKMRNFMGRGLDKALFIGIAVVMGISMVAYFGKPTTGIDGSGDGQSNVLFTLNGTQVTGEKFYEQYRPLTENQGMVNAFQDLSLQQRALEATIQTALREQLIAKHGIEATEEDVQAQIVKSLDAQFEQIKMQLKPEEQSAPNVNALVDKKLNELSKGQYKTFADLKKQQIAQFEMRIKDNPYLKQQALSDTASQLLMEKYQDDVKLTDADAMSRYEELHVFRLVIGGAGKPAQQAEHQANEVLKLVRGGLKFEEAVTRFSTHPNPEAKKKGGELGWMSKEAISNDPTMKGIEKLQPNQVSEVIKGQQPWESAPSFYIYLVKAARISPTFKQAEFDKQKADILKGMKQQRAYTRLQEDMKQAEETMKLEFSDYGYEALHRYTKEMQPTGKPLVPEAVTKVGNELLKELTSSKRKTQAKFIGLLRYTIASQMRTYASTPEERSRLLDVMINGLVQHMNFRVDPMLRISLANLYLEKKQNDLAKVQLEKASQAAQIANQETVGIHQQIAGAYSRMGMKSAAQKEQVIIVDLQKRIPKPPPGPPTAPPGPAPKSAGAKVKDAGKSETPPAAKPAPEPSP